MSPGGLRAGALSWRWAGILVGALAAAGAIALGTLGRGVLLAAPIFGLGALAGTLLGELTGPRPDGAVRRAALRVRRITDYVRPALGLVVAGSVGALAVLGTVTTLVASPDDLGRAGRTLVCSSGTMSAAAGPWPGSFYTLPGGALVLAGLMLAGLSLRRIVRRPQPAETAAADDALRRGSAEAAVAATGILVLVPLVGVALTSGAALISLADDCGAGWWAGAGWALIGLGGAAFVVALWMLAVLVLSPMRSGASVVLPMAHSGSPAVRPSADPGSPAVPPPAHPGPPGVSPPAHPGPPVVPPPIHPGSAGVGPPARPGAPE